MEDISCTHGYKAFTINNIPERAVHTQHVQKNQIEKLPSSFHSFHKKKTSTTQQWTFNWLVPRPRCPRFPQLAASTRAKCRWTKSNLASSFYAKTEASAANTVSTSTPKSKSGLSIHSGITCIAYITGYFLTDATTAVLGYVYGVALWAACI